MGIIEAGMEIVPLGHGGKLLTDELDVFGDALLLAHDLSLDVTLPAVSDFTGFLQSSSHQKHSDGLYISVIHYIND